MNFSFYLLFSLQFLLESTCVWQLNFSVRWLKVYFFLYKKHSYKTTENFNKSTHNQPVMRLINFYIIFFNFFSITSFKIVKRRLKKSKLIWLTSLIISLLFFNLPSLYFFTGNENYEKRFQNYFKDQGSSLLMQMSTLKTWIEIALILATGQYMTIFKSKQLLTLLKVSRIICFLNNIDIATFKARLITRIKLLLVAFIIARAAEFFSFDTQNTLTLFWALTNNFTTALRGTVIVLMLSSFVIFFNIIVEQCIHQIRSNKLNTVIQHYIILESKVFIIFNETFSKAYKITIIYIAAMLTIRVSAIKLQKVFLVIFIFRFITYLPLFDITTQLTTSSC